MVEARGKKEARKAGRESSKFQVSDGGAFWDPSVGDLRTNQGRGFGLHAALGWEEGGGVQAG
jgi:hypothetical protein